MGEGWELAPILTFPLGGKGLKALLALEDLEAVAA